MAYDKKVTLNPKLQDFCLCRSLEATLIGLVEAAVLESLEFNLVTICTFLEINAGYKIKTVSIIRDNAHRCFTSLTSISVLN